MRSPTVLVALAALLLTVACGATSPGPGAGLSGGGASMRVLSPSAVPDVPSKTTVLTAGDLTKDASIPDLLSKLSAWGYVDGRQRLFQGQSRHLTFVVSRALLFQGSAGAGAYVEFVHSNATSFFGIAGSQPLVAQGRSGWQFTPSACSCHLANPVVIGVVADGSGVAWLEINGPDATATLLLDLLDPARSVPATV